jgi:SSS family solute:Na+ symporter
VAASTLVWLAATWLTPAEPEETLLAFYRRVRPAAGLWGPIAARATDVVPPRDGLSNLASWIAGCVLVYASLFGVGKIIFGETALGLGMLALAVAAGGLIYRGLERRGWRTVVE